MKIALPDSVATRTIAVLVVGLTVSHMLSVMFYVTDRANEIAFAGGEHIAERTATIYRLIEHSTQRERQRLAELADGPKLHVIWSKQPTIGDEKHSSWQAGVLRDALADHLDQRSWSKLRTHYALTDTMDSWVEHQQKWHDGAPLGESFFASLQLSDGSWVNFLAPVKAPKPFWSARFAGSLLVIVVMVISLSALIVRYLTKPLATFAQAARQLGVDMNAPPLVDHGPTEVREAIRAFNEMQRRLKRFVVDRTQMIAAIAHDLGTPITRLRLRAEFVDDEIQREKMLADLDDMERMVFSTLSFARNDASLEPRAMVDLNTLLERIQNDAVDAGHIVSLTLPPGARPYSCQPVALRRALTNLVENAVKYGESAQVHLEESQYGITIYIDDQGPGIPEERQADMFLPFHRLDQSRSRETGGVGLGLTVARAAIRAHGGDISMRNRPDGGLRVEVRLPRQDQ